MSGEVVETTTSSHLGGRALPHGCRFVGQQAIRNIITIKVKAIHIAIVQMRGQLDSPLSMLVQKMYVAIAISLRTNFGH